MVGIEHAAAEKARVVVGPGIAQRRQLLVQLVEDLEEHLVVVVCERRVVGHVLQGHLRQFPQRADPADVREADLDGLERVLVLVERAAVGLRPADAVGTAHRLEPAVRLGHDERLHHADPGQRRGVARGDREPDRLRLRRGAEDQRAECEREYAEARPSNDSCLFVPHGSHPLRPPPDWPRDSTTRRRQVKRSSLPHRTRGRSTTVTSMTAVARLVALS